MRKVRPVDMIIQCTFAPSFELTLCFHTLSTDFIASQALREGAAKLRKDLATNADKKRGPQVGKALPSNDFRTLPSNEKVGEEFSDFVPPKKKVKQEPV